MGVFNPAEPAEVKARYKVFLKMERKERVERFKNNKKSKAEFIAQYGELEVGDVFYICESNGEKRHMALTVNDIRNFKDPDYGYMECVYMIPRKVGMFEDKDVKVPAIWNWSTMIEWVRHCQDYSVKLVKKKS